MKLVVMDGIRAVNTVEIANEVIKKIEASFFKNLDSDYLKQKEWLSSNEAARYLGIPLGSLRNKVSRGEIPFTKIGRLTRFNRRELEELLLSSKQGGFYGN